MNKTRKFLRSHRAALFLAASIFGVVTTSSADMVSTAVPDMRITLLEAFFRAHHCPAPLLVGEYLKAADANGIDFRLLPAVSVRESTCGRHARLNNRWGWNSARTGFESLAHGIEFVARELASGRPYRGKTMDDKLRAYNPNPEYPAEIRKLMREIASD